MIHLVVREPIAYQRMLCRALGDHGRGNFVAWFAGGDESDFSPADNFDRRFLAQGFGNLFSALRTDRDPVIVLGGWSSSFAYKTLLIAKALRVPTLIWADHPHPRQRSWGFNKLRTSYLQLLSHTVPGFLACGSPTVEHLAGFGISRDKIFHFPYWVELPAVWSLPESRSEHQDSRKSLRLIAVGRLVPMKGFDIAIKALASANQAAGRAIAELEIIGEGAERANLEHTVTATGQEKSVSFSGVLPNDLVLEKLEQADAVIVPSKFEPYGVVVLEALAHGRPVLASDRVIAAIDKDDGSGAILFHAAGDAELLAAQIERLAGDRNILAGAARAARTVAERWKPERAARILETILNERLPHRTNALSGLRPIPTTIGDRKSNPTSHAS